MTSSRLTTLNPQKIFSSVMILCIAVALIKAILWGREMEQSFAFTGNDHIMRLVSVRDWLAGQGWFDTTQYRLVPPDGTLMHWSRYVDVGIAAIILPLSWVLPMTTAEQLGVIIWPTLLMVILILIFGFGARRLFGPIAACFTMLLVLLWPFTSDFYFRAGRIDHHNVQTLMIVVMTLAIIAPARTVLAGVTAGVAAAFALAVGLETLLYILVLGLLLFGRAVFEVTPTAKSLLVSFAVTLALASVLFWFGQTPRSAYGLAVCDQLSTPVLSLAGIAAVVSLATTVPLLRGPALQVSVAVTLTAVGCAMAWPLLGPCVAGPYGDLPVAVQEIINTSISEALPAFVFAQRSPFVYLRMALPVSIVAVAAITFWWIDRQKPDQNAGGQDAVGQLLLLSVVGILASFSQVRLLLMTSAAAPLLSGFVLARLVDLYRAHRSMTAASGLIVVSILALMPKVLEAPLRRALPSTYTPSTVQDQTCFWHDEITTLNALPPAIFLNPMNLGPSLLWATHHSTIAGPYHRNPAAFENGAIPFELPDAEMETYVHNTTATHLVLCRGSNYGEGFATELAAGTQADWLRPIPVPADDLLVFEILPAGGA